MLPVYRSGEAFCVSVFPCRCGKVLKLPQMNHHTATRCQPDV